MRTLKTVAGAFLLCLALASCQDRDANQTGSTPERPGPNEPARGPGGPANPGNP